jgi:thymidylate kinase
MALVAVIGIDGSGKTTQCRLLADRLAANGIEAVCVRPAYFLIDSFSRLSRNKFRKNLSISPRKLSTSSVGRSSNRNISNIIKKVCLLLLGISYAILTCIYLKLFMSRNGVIICDRYFIQFLYDLLGRNAKIFLKLIPKADLTFYIEGNVEILISRMSQSFDRSVKREYYVDLNSFFKHVAYEYNFILISADMKKEDISEIIYARVEKYLKEEAFYLE